MLVLRAARRRVGPFTLCTSEKKQKQNAPGVATSQGRTAGSASTSPRPRLPASLLGPPWRSTGALGAWVEQALFFGGSANLSPPPHPHAHTRYDRCALCDPPRHPMGAEGDHAPVDSQGDAQEKLLMPPIPHPPPSDDGTLRILIASDNHLVRNMGGGGLWMEDRPVLRVCVGWPTCAPPPCHSRRACGKRTRRAATTRLPRLMKCLSWPSRTRCVVCVCYWLAGKGSADGACASTSSFRHPPKKME